MSTVAAVAAVTAVTGFNLGALSPVANAATPAAHHYASPTLHFSTHNNAADPTFNQLLGINDRGVMAGYFGSGQPGHPNKGYTLSGDHDQDNYRNENFPGSAQTQVTAINDRNQTVGFWVDSVGNSYGFADVRGHFTDVVDPHGQGAAAGGATTEQLLGVNEQNQAVGFWTDANGNNHGFRYDLRSRTFHEIHVPGQASVMATSINDRGDVAISASDGNTQMAYLLHHGRAYAVTAPGGGNIQAFGINDRDQVVGQYTDSAGVAHGYEWNRRHIRTIDDPNGIGSTVVNGLNNHGDLVGFYVDAAGNTDGFLAATK
ncbi:hypothetical protein [Leekyejoonella antrihumi]|nr:hypothetical protein [Leekyejoonella antrihumi]